EWKLTDVIAEASLIGGLFGEGGGGEVRSALMLDALEKQFGRKAGRAAWRDFREANDPEAPTTVAQAYRYETGSPFATRGLALPDPGSASFVEDGEPLAAPAAATASARKAPRLRAARLPAPGARVTDTPAPQVIPHDRSIGARLLRQAGHESNWELV